MNEEYWKQHMEHQQRVNDEIRAFRKQRSKFIFDVYREQKRMNNPGKCDEELHIDKPFVNEINFDFWDKEILQLEAYFKKLFHLK